MISHLHNNLNGILFHLLFKSSDPFKISGSDRASNGHWTEKHHKKDFSQITASRMCYHDYHTQIDITHKVQVRVTMKSTRLTLSQCCE